MSKVDVFIVCFFVIFDHKTRQRCKEYKNLQRLVVTSSLVLIKTGVKKITWEDLGRRNRCVCFLGPGVPSLPWLRIGRLPGDVTGSIHESNMAAAMELRCWGGDWGLPSVHTESLIVLVTWGSPRERKHGHSIRTRCSQWNVSWQLVWRLLSVSVLSFRANWTALGGFGCGFPACCPCSRFSLQVVSLHRHLELTFGFSWDNSFERACRGFAYDTSCRESP